jgi:hypothetical protein
MIALGVWLLRLGAPKIVRAIPNQEKVGTRQRQLTISGFPFWDGYFSGRTVFVDFRVAEFLS